MTKHSITKLASRFVLIIGVVNMFADMTYEGGAQDSLLKAVLVGVLPPERRSTAFGVFDTGFGIAWFVGSAVMGL
jgi:hypothetical protein